MVGRPVRTDGIWHPPSPAQVVLRADNLGLNVETSADSSVLVSEISFALKAGEILGVAGVSGNGQSELLELLAGIRAPNSGSIQIGERHITAEMPSSPSEVKSLSVAHVPEDRHLTGLILSFSAAESMVLGYEEKIAGGMAGWLDREQLGEHCASLMRDFDVRPPDPSLKSSLFSGGNQQKIVLAREMSAAPSILLVGQATRGVDIGAIEFIHKQLIAMRDKGCAIILVSVELDEILTLSDRIMVMNNGSSMGIVDRKEADARSIGLLMAGVR
jgi:simple sugar transport system ATP-binding protein